MMRISSIGRADLEGSPYKLKLRKFSALIFALVGLPKSSTKPHTFVAAYDAETKFIACWHLIAEFKVTLMNTL